MFKIWLIVSLIAFINQLDFVVSQDKCSQFGGCKGLSMVSRLSPTALGWSAGTVCTSLWGWTDPRDSRKYIILTCELGQSIIDITDPAKPKPIAKLIGYNGGEFRWRDVKVYKDFAFFVSDCLESKVQILDLKAAVNKARSSKRQLLRSDDDKEDDKDIMFDDNGEILPEMERHLATQIVNLQSSKIYVGGGIYQAHNIEINVASGFAYAVGGGNNCKNGLHMINIQDPMNPKFAGCYSDIENQYIHDAHCVTYTKDYLDGKYDGREICFAFAVRSLLIVDVTDKKNPKLLSRLTWPNAAYIHQGWLTVDRSFLVIDDERDTAGDGIKTFLADVRDLDNPKLAHVHVAYGETFADHNQYIVPIGDHDYTFQANYAGGVRV